MMEKHQMATNSLTQEQLKEHLSYDESTGIFLWKKSGKKRTVGNIAGTCDPKIGYVRICLNRKYYAAHRLAWLYVYGFHPEKRIDHINRIRNDNRICNLRDISCKQNLENSGIWNTNTSGYKGVCWNKKAKKWVAQITHNYKHHNLGYFKTKEEAHQAYKEAAKELFTHLPKEM
jgi:hypothetical protein